MCVRVLHSGRQTGEEAAMGGRWGFLGSVSSISVPVTHRTGSTGLPGVRRKKERTKGSGWKRRPVSTEVWLDSTAAQAKPQNRTTRTESSKCHDPRARRHAAPRARVQRQCALVRSRVRRLSCAGRNRRGQIQLESDRNTGPNRIRNASIRKILVQSGPFGQTEVV